MNWTLPNQLTMGRLALSAVFFGLLALYDLRLEDAWLLNVCLAIYIVAGITDVLDGYLARKWNQTTAFGRIADPFVDKVLVCGAFALLAGNNFAFSSPDAANPEIWAAEKADLPHWLTGDMATGVQAWMVVVVMGREFVISAIRGYSESQGTKFPATVWGKMKMFTQSVAICGVLAQLAWLPGTMWAVYAKLVTVWVAVLMTLFSGLAYVRKARKLMMGQEERH